MPTLKSLVDETSNIKNELVNCYDNLKNNLIEKNIECSEEDKISTLIDKVGDIVLDKKCIPGTTYTLGSMATFSSDRANARSNTFTSLTSGICRIAIVWCCNICCSNTYLADLKLEIKDEEKKILYTNSWRRGYSDGDGTIVLEHEIKPMYTITVTGCGVNNNGNIGQAHVKSVEITCGGFE